MDSANPFKGRHFAADIILLCVRWYLRYSLSYRDLEEMMAERGLPVDHTTIYRWVQRYAPELEQRVRPHLKLTNDSWRVDETYLRHEGASDEWIKARPSPNPRLVSKSLFPSSTCVAGNGGVRSWE